MIYPRRVLITGAAGNLGAKLAANLQGRCETVLLDKPDGDLSVWDNCWTSRFAGIDAVVHLAGNPVAYHDWNELMGPNIDAVVNVFAAAARMWLSDNDFLHLTAARACRV